jgi:hypothetical protein
MVCLELRSIVFFLNKFPEISQAPTTSHAPSERRHIPNCGKVKMEHGGRGITMSYTNYLTNQTLLDL